MTTFSSSTSSSITNVSQACIQHRAASGLFHFHCGCFRQNNTRKTCFLQKSPLSTTKGEPLGLIHFHYKSKEHLINPTDKVNHKALSGLTRIHCKPQRDRQVHMVDFSRFTKHARNSKSVKNFKIPPPLSLTTWEPFGLLHFHWDPRSLSGLYRLNPFAGARNNDETRSDSKPPSGGQRAVVGDDARGPVHGVGRERLAAQGRDEGHPDSQARVVGQKRHAALFVKVQRQLSPQVGVEIENDWPNNHSGIRSSYTTSIVKPNLPLEILSL